MNLEQELKQGRILEAGVDAEAMEGVTDFHPKTHSVCFLTAPKTPCLWVAKVTLGWAQAH